MKRRKKSKDNMKKLIKMKLFQQKQKKKIKFWNKKMNFQRKNWLNKVKKTTKFQQI